MALQPMYSRIMLLLFDHQVVQGALDPQDPSGLKKVLPDHSCLLCNFLSIKPEWHSEMQNWNMTYVQLGLEWHPIALFNDHFLYLIHYMYVFIFCRRISHLHWMASTKIFKEFKKKIYFYIFLWNRKLLLLLILLTININ